MIPMLARRWWTAVLLLPWLLAALACSLPARPAAPSGAALTQAAATITAAANVIATSQAAATLSLPNPTAVPPTSAPAATATTAATAASTAAPSATAAPTVQTTAASAAPAAVDPCGLLSVDEVKAILGVDVGRPKEQQGACLFADAATGQSSGVMVYALPAGQASSFLDLYKAQLQQAKIKFDSTQLDKDVADGDMVAAVNDLIAITAGQSDFHAEKLDGVGDAAIWSWNSILTLQQASLVAARPDAILALLVVGPETLKEAAVQPALVPIANRILTGLPDPFTIATPTPGAGAELDPCSLITTADAAAILGAPAKDGTSASGECQYQDQTTSKEFVRVFASQSSADITTLLQMANQQILIGDQTAAAKVDTDITAGDWVAALNDMAAGRPVMPGQIVKKLDGVAAAAVYSSIPTGGLRLVYVLAVHGQDLVGMQMNLKSGDAAATEKIVAPLLHSILANLPAQFTVTGAP